MKWGDGRELEVWIEACLLEYQDLSASGRAETPERFVALKSADVSARERLLERLRLLQRLERGLSDLPGDPIRPGTTIADFEVLELLGAGGMGQVFRARQISLARVVALKVPHRGDALEPRARLRFLREAQVVAQLRHPGIVPVYQVGEHRGSPFLVMELSSGRSLAAILGDLGQGRVERTGAALGHPDESYERAAARVALSVLESLQAAHDAGVVHRDVKPGNVLLEAHGRVRVVDFGLAHLADQDSLTESRELIGTAGYTAPEVISNPAAAGPYSDVYSAGVVLYQLLALRRPFEGETVLEILRRVETKDLPALASSDGIARPLSAIVERAMAREIGQRYASARDFAEDLRAYLDGGEVRARASTVWTRLGRRMQRHPALTSVSVVLTLALALLIGVWRNAREVRAEVDHTDAVALTREGLLWRFADGEPLGQAPRQLAGHTQAIDRLEGALRLDPTLLEARVELAQYAALHGLSDRAMELLDGLEADGIRLRSLAWTRTAMLDPSRSKIRPEEGEDATSVDVQDLDRLAWARHFLSSNQNDAAMEVLRPIEQHPILGPAACYSQFEACCTRGRRDIPRGLGYLRQALAFVPEHPILLANLQSLLDQRLNELDPALAPAEEDPQRRAAVNLQNAQYVKSDMAALAPRFEAAEQSAPWLRVLWLNHAVLLARLDRLEEAAEIARRGLEHHPLDPLLLDVLATAILEPWANESRPASAIREDELEDLQEMLELALEDPQASPEFLYFLTLVHYVREDRDGTSYWGERARREFIEPVGSSVLGSQREHFERMMRWADGPR